MLGSSLFIFLLSIVTLNNVSCSSFVNCPDISKAQLLALEFEKQVKWTIGKATMDFRVPEDGLLDTTITCIVIIDLSTDGSGGVVEIVNGGAGSRSVEVRITSQPFKGLHYKFEFYTESDWVENINTGDYISK